jgi:hypothetical protein
MDGRTKGRERGREGAEERKKESDLSSLSLFLSSTPN